MASQSTTVTQGGRIVIPAKLRKRLGIEIGDTVDMEYCEETGELHLANRAHRLRRAQTLAQQQVVDQTSAVDALIKERRAEAASE